MSKSHMMQCMYCSEEMPSSEFSDEHIWPRALGGDFLPKDVWRTDNVCRRCNSISGVFIDGAFIRSWMGQAELSSGSRDYLAGKEKVSAVPLDYLGPLQGVPVPDGHVADYWTGPCGANIIHIRPDDGDEQWTTYAGGDPKGKKAKAGRAYIALTSEVEFWILVGLESFRRHFDRAERFVVNVEIPNGWPFKMPDQSIAVQSEDMKTVEAVLDASRTGSGLRVKPAISFDLGSRMLAKLGIGIGYKLLGAAFLQTDYAKNLRLGMREANSEKRRLIPVRGSGFLAGRRLGGAETILAWPGGWVLMINIVAGELALCVISPSGNSMSVLISDDKKLVSNLDLKFRDGLVWITVPAASEAVGPIPLPGYLAHKTNMFAIEQLVALAAKRGDRAKLPPCLPK
jgi:hypothetical protein